MSVSSVSSDECQIKSVTNVVTLLLPHPSQHLVLTQPASNAAAFTLGFLYSLAIVQWETRFEIML